MKALYVKFAKRILTGVESDCTVVEETLPSNDCCYRQVVRKACHDWHDAPHKHQFDAVEVDIAACPR